MAENFLQLNQNKTEDLVIGTEAQRNNLNLKLQALALNPRQQVKNLGVIFDSDLSFETHIRNIIKKVFYQLKDIARVQPFLSQANTETLMHAFITCRIDYCNALGLPKKNKDQLYIHIYI